MFDRILITIARPIARIIYPLRVIGKENIPKNGGFIICGNHTALLDPVFLLLTCPRRIYFMAKEELMKKGIAKWFFKKFHVFTVKRGAGDIESINYAINLVENGEILGIFPEGKRSRDYTPQNAKAGIALIAHSAKADILPVGIYAKGRIKPFKLTTVRYGELIKYKDLGMSEAGGRSEYKAASTKIMDEIKHLWGMGHEKNTAR